MGPNPPAAGFGTSAGFACSTVGGLGVSAFAALAFALAFGAGFGEAATGVATAASTCAGAAGSVGFSSILYGL